MRKRLELLRAEANDLQQKLSDNRKEETKLMIEIYKEDNKLAVGDTVMLEGKKGVIVEFKRKYGDIEPQVQLYNKGGELGKRIVSVWRWRADRMQKVSE